MMILECGQVHRPAVQLERIAVRMVVGRNKINAEAGTHESKHARKLIGQVQVIVFSEVDEFRVFLGQEDLELLAEGSAVARVVHLYDCQLV